MAVSPLAAQDYPKGLFENSPVIPSGPGGPNAPEDAGPPSADSNGGWTEDDFCASIQSRTFRSMAEVRRAHARCDRLHGEAPPPVDQPDQ